MSDGENVAVIYHRNCLDGFCAAWLFHKVFPKADFIPAQYGQDPPNVDKKEVYILDFSYKRDVLFKLWTPNNDGTQVRKLVILDHHKTAEEELRDFDVQCIANGMDAPEIIFDMQKSGCRLAWEYLWENHFGKKYGELWNIHTGEKTCGNKAPWIVDYTEDRDLWRWRLTDSKAITTALRSYPFDFDLWDSFESRYPQDFIVEGTAILRSEAVVIENHIRNAREIEMSGHKVLAVNATVLFSDIAGKLADGRPFGAAYFDRGDGRRQWSLRSSEHGVDVSEIAKEHGGGGHKHAAGFEQVI